MANSDSFQGTDSVLTVNVGSSSLRLQSWSLTKPAKRLAKANFSPAPAIESEVFSNFLARENLPHPRLIIHRVVHGGTTLTAPTLLTETVLDEIKRLSSMAPLHNETAMKWIGAARKAFGSSLLQSACFDTAFYANLPEPAARYALPPALADRYGLRRYGFHGLAHQSMLEQWQSHCEPGTKRKAISLQLGSGCSITATDNGLPAETSMGFTPLEGLVMATRSGNLDPAAVLYLIDQSGMSTAEIGEILNKHSGLLGISGESGDMQTLLASQSETAKLAIAMFCNRATQFVGAYMAALRGADAILFGGGIGEHSTKIRHQILEPLDWAGVRVDQNLNQGIDPRRGGSIHAAGSQVEIWVTPSDEARVMAQAAPVLLRSHTSSDNPKQTEISE